MPPRPSAPTLPRWLTTGRGTLSFEEQQKVTTSLEEITSDTLAKVWEVENLLNLELHLISRGEMFKAWNTLLKIVSRREYYDSLQTRTLGVSAPFSTRFTTALDTVKTNVDRAHKLFCDVTARIGQLEHLFYLDCQRILNRHSLTNSDCETNVLKLVAMLVKNKGIRDKMADPDILVKINSPDLGMWYEGLMRDLRSTFNAIESLIAKAMQGTANRVKGELERIRTDMRLTNTPTLWDQRAFPLQHDLLAILVGTDYSWMIGEGRTERIMRSMRNRELRNACSDAVLLLSDYINTIGPEMRSQLANSIAQQAQIQAQQTQIQAVRASLSQHEVQLLNVQTLRAGPRETTGAYGEHPRTASTPQNQGRHSPPSFNRNASQSRAAQKYTPQASRGPEHSGAGADALQAGPRGSPEARVPEQRLRRVSTRQDHGVQASAPVKPQVPQSRAAQRYTPQASREHEHLGAQAGAQAGAPQGGLPESREERPRRKRSPRVSTPTNLGMQASAPVDTQASRSTAANRYTPQALQRLTILGSRSGGERERSGSRRRSAQQPTPSARQASPPGQPSGYLQMAQRMHRGRQRERPPPERNQQNRQSPRRPRIT